MIALTRAYEVKPGAARLVIKPCVSYLASRFLHVSDVRWRTLILRLRRLRSVVVSSCLDRFREGDPAEFDPTTRCVIIKIVVVNYCKPADSLSARSTNKGIMNLTRSRCACDSLQLFIFFCGSVGRDPLPDQVPDLVRIPHTESHTSHLIL